MNPAEIASGISAYLEVAAVYLALFLSVLSAYLFVAYSVGKELKPLQARFVSILFVVFGVMLVVSSLRLNIASYLFQTNYTEDQSIFALFGPYVVAIIQGCSILGALVFMRDIRKSN